MMLFQETLLAVLSKHKTQTRRPWHDGDYGWIQGELPTLDTERAKLSYSAVRSATSRLRYQVGKTYAVQAKRGQPTVFFHPDHPCNGIDIWPVQERVKDWFEVGTGQGYRLARIKLDAIGREDVRKISVDDAVKEGFTGPFMFLATWTLLYDQVAYKKRPDLQSPTLATDYLGWQRYLQARPLDLYRAWILHFHLDEQE